MSDLEKEFNEMTENLLSLAEQQMGVDLYNERVATSKAETQMTLALAARQAAVAGLYTTLPMLLLILSLPAQVWLWKWAL